MKQLTCEMCGSTDILKQEGVYVCQNCGCKYSVEEAKKMMIEGTVEVQGTVSVDNSSFISNSLANARRAIEKTDWEEAETYYNKVEQHEPRNIEAVFFSAFGKTMMSLYDADIFKRGQKFEVFTKSISVIDDYYEPEKSEELKPILLKMSEQLKLMYSTQFVYNNTQEQGIQSDIAKTLAMFANIEIQFVESLANIAAKDNSEYILHLLVEHYLICINESYIVNNVYKATTIGHIDYDRKKLYKERALKVIEKIKKINPNYVPPEIKLASPLQGCLGCLGVIVIIIIIVAICS